MTEANSGSDVLRPITIAGALDALGGGRQIMAGATWLMRAPVRGEAPPKAAVLIGSIPELQQISIGQDQVTLGAGVTHTKLAEALAGVPALKGLVTAASRAANPPIRAVATLGGNLCTAAFAAGDLSPQLLALDARVTYATKDGTQDMDMSQFLAARGNLSGGLLTRVRIPLGNFRSAHARLPLRKAGDYPVAIVSARMDQNESLMRRVRIAVGSVEATPRRWSGLEAALEGQPYDLKAIADSAGSLTNEFTGRDGVEADGWYRTKVLPALVRQVFEDLSMQFAERP
ncbi:MULTISPECIES: FAD binding domain-containing protein [Mesorhizobium]|uniref:FAD-binding molybdopterin dehydrogenase n=1 Tax=Mesorhizobium denitrificans TaxID=2294114 RepID=A0A371XIS1_9HYPH|nr:MULTISPECIES: FAD binding domain-containing protein [Mesorhizobium]RFC68944.1 FAD-binding molybdopterin dehydrogenase [Mesorhizobium denitrificans]